MPARFAPITLLLLPTLVGCETTARISAAAEPAWALGSQQLVDPALGRLRGEAAMLGADGMLLRGISDRHNVSLGPGIAASEPASVCPTRRAPPLGDSLWFKPCRPV